MKSTVKALDIIAIILFALFAGLIGKADGEHSPISHANGKQDAEIEQILLNVSEQTNKQLPMMVDEETRLDLTTVAGKTMSSKYTMVNIYTDELDKNEFKKDMAYHLKKNKCALEDTNRMLNLGAKYNYMYFGKEGKFISSILISKDSC